MIADDITITMLGASGSGKTCYMLGMYARMQLGLRRMTLRAEHLNDDNMLSHRWDSLVTGEPENRWPTGTKKNDPYLFLMSYTMLPFVKFSWLDYRGAALDQEEDEEDFKELLGVLGRSTCVFLCVSGEYLVNPVRKNYEPWFGSARIHRMNTLIEKAIAERQKISDKPFPVVVMITQFDRCQGRDPDDIYEEIREYLFPKLFDPGAPCLAMICPVSLGHQLQGDPPAGPIEPENLELPVIFAIYAGFREYGLGLSNKALSLRNQVEQDEDRNWLRRWWSRDEMKSRRSEQRTLETKLAELQEKLELLLRDLERKEQVVDIYERGVKQTSLREL